MKHVRKVVPRKERASGIKSATEVNARREEGILLPEGKKGEGESDLQRLGSLHTTRRKRGDSLKGTFQIPTCWESVRFSLQEP